MHGTITKTTRTGRAAIMRAAWADLRAARAEHDAWARGLADELHSRRAFIAAAETPAERDRRIASVTGSYRQFSAREPAAPRFGDCLRAAWATARRAAPAPLTGFAAERMAADCLPFEMETTRLARHADIDRREAAARAHANAH